MNNGVVVKMLPDGGPCPRCVEVSRSKRSWNETIRYFEIADEERSYTYNVTAAYKWAQDARLEPAELPKHIVQELILVNMSETFYGAHVDHVDTTEPAMIGVLHEKLVLMDGTHRLFRLKKENKRLLAYVLDEEQTARFAINRVPAGFVSDEAWSQ